MEHLFFFFFFNDTATTEIYTLSLHDALPTCLPRSAIANSTMPPAAVGYPASLGPTDRKSTRLNSSHLGTSYAVFCLKKKKKKNKRHIIEKKKKKKRKKQ